MHSRDCFWKPFGSERVKMSQKLLKSAEKCFYPTFWSFWAKLSSKKLFLIGSEILGMLVNTLTANYEYSRSNRENLVSQIEIKLSKKPLKFYAVLFFNFSDLHQVVNVLTKTWASGVKYFWSYWLQKICLFKCITAIVSENPLAVNVLTSLKNSWNLQKSSSILLFNHSEPNWAWKSYLYSVLRF